METGFFDEILDEWTDGLQYPESRIAVFNHIRDIPYAIMPDQTDPVRGPLNLLKVGRGHCGSKHFLLGILFERLGIPIRYVSIPFSWDQPDIQYPDKLRGLAASLPVSYHLACRASIGERWTLVDATWDPPLAAAGFPVNTGWDGLSDTIPAVVPTLVAPPDDDRPVAVPISEVIHESAGERPELYKRARRRYTLDEIARRKEFDVEFNMWLEEVRAAGRQRDEL